MIERDYNKLFERLVRVVLLVEKIKLRVLRNAHSNFSTFTHFYHLLWCHKVNISFSFFSQSFVTFNSYLFIFFSRIVVTTRKDAIFKSRARSPELGERAANKWRTRQQKNIDGQGFFFLPPSSTSLNTSGEGPLLLHGAEAARKTHLRVSLPNCWTSMKGYMLRDHNSSVI